MEQIGLDYYVNLHIANLCPTMVQNGVPLGVLLGYIVNPLTLDKKPKHWDVKFGQIPRGS